VREGHVDIAVALKKERHFRQRVAYAQMFHVSLQLGSCRICGEGHRLVGGEVVVRIGLLEVSEDGAVDPVQVVRTGREQVHHQEMHAEVQG